MPIRYCLICCHVDEVILGTHRIIEVHGNEQHYWLEWKECIGPFAEVPPPDTDEPTREFDLSAEELAISDRNADEFLVDILRHFGI